MKRMFVVLAIVTGMLNACQPGGTASIPNEIAAWRKAAAQGDTEAQYIIGTMYHKGYGVRQDKRRAKAVV